MLVPVALSDSTSVLAIRDGADMGGEYRDRRDEGLEEEDGLMTRKRKR